MTSLLCLLVSSLALLLPSTTGIGEERGATFVCPTGSYAHVVDGAEAHACELCPSGRYGSSASVASGGALRSSACSGPCEEGYFCPAGSVHPRGDGAACDDVRHYCPQGTPIRARAVNGYYTIPASSPMDPPPPLATLVGRSSAPTGGGVAPAVPVGPSVSPNTVPAVVSGVSPSEDWSFTFPTPSAAASAGAASASSSGVLPMGGMRVGITFSNAWDLTLLMPAHIACTTAPSVGTNGTGIVTILNTAGRRSIYVALKGGAPRPESVTLTITKSRLRAPAHAHFYNVTGQSTDASGVRF